MKKYILYLLSILTVACGDFDRINTNPDASTSVPPAFLATNAILSITQVPGGKWYLGDSWLMKQTTYTEVNEEYLYNLFERSGFGSYAMLVNTEKMVKLAEESHSEGVQNAYKALDKFMQAYTFYGATMDMGDVPCSEALKSEQEGIFAPKYDPQEKVFESILNLLKSSSDLFASAEDFEGDPIYEGDVVLWRKAVNSFTLRVLNMISKKEKVGSIDVRSMFEKVATQPLLEYEDESLMRVYSSSVAAQWHPFYFKRNHYVYYSFMSSYFVDLLKDLKDYRLFYYAEPAKKLLSEHNENSFDAYCGVDMVMPYGDVQDQCNSGSISNYNNRYTQVPEGEPTKYISYSDQQFVLAEAALRGWNTPKSAKEYYEDGIRAAMLFTAENTSEQYRHGVTIDDAYIDEYLAGKAAFDENKGLEQILTQKYLGSLLQMPWNSYYDYRRTGFPEIPINPETNLNAVKDQMPLRWMYPESEYSVNKDNVTEALQRQFGGSDTPNGVMWILK